MTPEEQTDIKEEALEETIDSETPEKEDRKESRKERKPKEQLVELENKNGQLAAEAKKWQNKYYEAYADMDNLRKVMDKDHQTMVKYRGQGFLEALLPMFDNFYNCFKYKPDDPKLAAYCQGFEMIYNQMVHALESEGVKEIVPSIGSKFDHTCMQAVEVVDGEEDDIVVRVHSKGYFLKDRLVRAASVVVSKKPQPKAEEKPAEEEKSSEAANENK